jgi:hypothetical protein
MACIIICGVLLKENLFINNEALTVTLKLTQSFAHIFGSLSVTDAAKSFNAAHYY